MNSMTTDKIAWRDGEELDRICAFLRRGELVALPTETVYGLAGDATNVEACIKIFAAKERPSFDPLIVHVATFDLDHLHDNGIINRALISASARSLMEQIAKRFAPGPVTILLPRGESIPDIVTSGSPEVGIRCPAHPVMQAILRSSGLALAAPSANRFGRVSPTTASHVMEELSGRIAAVVDAGPTHHGIESTVVRVSPGRIEVLRPGAISFDALQELPAVMIERSFASSSLTSAKAQPSPGQLDSHYAPRQGLLLVDAVSDAPREWLKASAFSLLAFGSDACQDALSQLRSSGFDVANTVVLNDEVTGIEAARELFGALRSFERGGERILAIASKKTSGLWPAIFDRLWRASHPKIISPR